MASFGSRGNDDNGYSSMPKFFRFFQIISNEITDTEKLLIPEDFVREHRNNLPSSVFLKARTDAVWKVELGKHDNDIYFLRGWSEFANYFTLKYGHFLVFEYDGNYQFNVNIFKRSGMEIKYPPSTRENSPSSCLQSCKRKTGTSKKKILKSHCSAVKHNEKGLSSAMQTLGPCEKVKAFKKASGFKSDKHFFRVVVQPTYAQRNILNVPSSFAKKYLTEKRGNVMFYGSDGKTWPAKYYRNEFNGKVLTKIYHGWKAFVRDNSLKLGDVCIFELIDSAKISLKAVIFRRIEDVRHHVSPDSSQKVCPS